MIVGFAILNFTVTAGAHVHHCYKDCQPTSTPIPTINPCLEWPEACISVTPTITIEPTEPVASPSAMPTEEVKHEDNHVGGTSETKAPQCPNGETTNVVANPHVFRSGSDATVNFFITEGDSANIYYSVVGQSHWGNAVSNIKANSDNFVSYTIHDLNPQLGYDFGIQQVRGCSGGKTTAVIIDGAITKLFQLSYWE